MNILLCVLLFKQHCSKSICMHNQNHAQGFNKNTGNKRAQENAWLILGDFSRWRGKGAQWQVAWKSRGLIRQSLCGITGNNPHRNMQCPLGTEKGILLWVHYKHPAELLLMLAGAFPGPSRRPRALLDVLTAQLLPPEQGEAHRTTATESQNHKVTEPKNHRITATEPQSHRTKELQKQPQNHRVTESWNHRIMVSQNQRITESQNQRISETVTESQNPRIITKTQNHRVTEPQNHSTSD